METCAQCKGTIPESETPCVFEDRIVCAACHATLSAAAGEAPRSEEVLFEREGKVVTNARVADQNAGVAFEHVYSVTVERTGFHGSVAVVVADTRKRRRRFIFMTPANAADFIAAMKRVKRLLIIEPDHWQALIAEQASPA